MNNNKKPIHIKSENVGSFTRLCNLLSPGSGVTNKCIQHYKTNGTPVQKKKAIFAENARKWH